MAEEKKGSWTDIFKTFKYAISPQKIVVAFVGLIVFNLLNYAWFREHPILVTAGRHLANAFSFAFGYNGSESGINLMSAAREMAQIFWSLVPINAQSATFLDVVRLGSFYLIVWIVFALIVGVITRISG